jgi:hypothetical protein
MGKFDGFRAESGEIKRFFRGVKWELIGTSSRELSEVLPPEMYKFVQCREVGDPVHVYLLDSFKPNRRIQVKGEVTFVKGSGTSKEISVEGETVAGTCILRPHGWTLIGVRGDLFELGMGEGGRY